VPGQHERGRVRPGDRREDLIAGFPLVVLPDGCRARRAGGLGIVDGHELGRVGVGERGEQDRVEDAEHGRRDADPEGKGEDGQHGDGPPANESADGMADVASESRHRGASP
jgi:hypothetical protein